MFTHSLLWLSLCTAPLIMHASEDTAALNVGDEIFIYEVMNTSAGEVQVAEAALKRALTEPEWTFTEKVIVNRLALMRSLRHIASTKDVDVSDEVQADDQGRIATVAEVADKDFNPTFLKGQITSAMDEIAICNQEINEGTDEDLIAFARNALPGLQDDIAIAKEFLSKY